MTKIYRLDLKESEFYDLVALLTAAYITDPNFTKAKHYALLLSKRHKVFEG